MTTVIRSRRDLGITALVEGFLALVIAWWPGSEVTPGLVTGLGSGLLLLIFGAMALVRAFRTPVPA